MKLPTFQNLKSQKYLVPHTRFYEGYIEGIDGTYLGIDPGVNFGITLLRDHYVQVVYGHLPPTKTTGMYGVEAYNFIKSHVFSLFVGDNCHAVIEGAAYHSKFGQVGLEEVRFAFFLGLYHAGWDVRILPPSTIRLLATGSGNDKAFERWPSMNNNAADSIYCAMAATMKGDFSGSKNNSKTSG